MNALLEKAKLYWKAILGCVLAIVDVALFFSGIYTLDQPKEAGILYFIICGGILAIAPSLIYAQVGVLFRIPEGVIIIFSLVIFIGGGVLTVFNLYYAVFIGFGFVSFLIVGILPIFQLPSGMKFLHREGSDTSKHPAVTKRQVGSPKRSPKNYQSGLSLVYISNKLPEKLSF